ncbi:copper resistance CopC/CopD family protein [Streptomyces sp. NBC_00467]|uniref:copper resistance CopC/CopD family protein n=1 Tax=Streptomyces sp. NBC_00467 TaxID=2975752 RepID=UPI002E18E65F
MHTESRLLRIPLTALVLVGAVLAFLLGGAGPASAHAVLTKSEPADVSVLKTAPKYVTLTFSEAVSLSDGSLRVLSPKNQRVEHGAVTHAGGKATTARVLLRGKLPKGTYTVSWRTVSADSHPVSGAFTFSVGKPSVTTAVASDESPDDTAASRLYDFFRYVAYSGFALLIGAALFVLVCWPAGAGLRPMRRLLLTGWTAVLVSTVVLLLLRGAYETGQGLTVVFDLPLLGRTITGRSGTALVARLLLLAAAAVLLALVGGRLRRNADGTGKEPAANAASSHVKTSSEMADLPPEESQVDFEVRAVGAVLVVGLALTWAAAGHASTGTQVPLAIPGAVLHLLAMAAWLGGLVALAGALYRAPAGTVIPAAAVARFSRLAFTAVIVLVVTGVYQSWRQVGSLDALTTTEYGKLLILKVGAVVLVLAAAAFSRQWTAQLIEEPQPRENLPAFPAAVTQGARVGQSVGVGASSGGDTAEATQRAGPPCPRDPADSPGADPCGSPSDRYRRGLRRSVVVEAVIGVVVLTITTVLNGTQPSRAALQSIAAATAYQRPPATVVTVPFDVGTPNGHGMVQITFDPGQVGDNTVQAIVFGPDTGVSTVPELRLTLTQLAQRIGPLDAKLVDRKGYWWADNLRLPLPGTWTMRLTVRITDIDQVTVTKNVTINPPPA